MYVYMYKYVRMYVYMCIMGTYVCLNVYMHVFSPFILPKNWVSQKLVKLRFLPLILEDSDSE